MSTQVQVSGQTPSDQGPSIGELAKNASTQLSTIIRGEIELAKTELKFSVKNAGIGIAFFGVAAVLLVYSLTFGLIAAAEGIHQTGLPRWASFLIVFGALALLAVLFVLIGIRLVKKVKAPQRTIATTKDTAAFLKHPTQS